MDQPGRGERAQATDQAEGDVVAQRNGGAAHFLRHRLDHEGRQAAIVAADQHDEAELADQDHPRLMAVHQPEQWPGGGDGEAGDGDQHRPATDAVGQPRHADLGRDQQRHADGVDGERLRRRDAVGELQPAHDVDEHQVEIAGTTAFLGCWVTFWEPRGVSAAPLVRCQLRCQSGRLFHRMTVSKHSREPRRHHYVPEFLLRPWIREWQPQQQLLRGYYWDRRADRLRFRENGVGAFCYRLDLLTLHNRREGRAVLESRFFQTIDEAGQRRGRSL